jgi:transposase
MATPPLYARQPATPAEERQLAASRHAPATWIQRARIITARWDGATVTQVAQSVGCHPKTVYKWLHRFNAQGLEGLADLPRPGARRLTEHECGRIIQLARTQPPGRLIQDGDGRLAPAQPEAPAHWTLDTLTEAAQAEGIRVGRSQVRQILLAEGARWRGTRSWMQSTDPEFAPKTPMPGRAPRRMRMGRGLAELGVPWCSKPVQKTDAWGRPGTANCCCEHVLQRPAILFERYCDDAVVHCASEQQARQVRDAIADRLAGLGLELHPDKTRIVYCKDDDRRGEHAHTSFTFLGYRVSSQAGQEPVGEALRELPAGGQHRRGQGDGSGGPFLASRPAQ